MQAMVDYLSRQFPDVPAEYVDVALAFQVGPLSRQRRRSLH